MTIYPIRKQTRLKEYNYSTPGFYYVTICTHNREEKFGQINDGVMSLNRYGQIAKNMWEDIPVHYFDIEIDAITVMPNHIHGIIIINTNENRNKNTNTTNVGQRLAFAETKIRKYQRLSQLLDHINQA